MRMRSSLIIARQLFTLICLAFAGCQSGGPVGNGPSGSDGALTISAAASLKDAFTQIAALYKQRTGKDVVFNFGASGTLQKQIETGAAVDIFASAGSKQMDGLAGKGLIAVETRRDFAGNELVLIAPKDSKLGLLSFEQLGNDDVKHVAIGNPKTVPAGEYSQQMFSFIKLDDVIQRKLVLAEDVRQVLDYVERGEVDAGIVYRTDAIAAGDKIKVAAIAPRGSHDPILYPVATTKDSRQKDAAGKFIAVLVGEEGQSILRNYGFSPINDK